MEKIYCKRCIMNNISDKFIQFNETGFCNYCSKALIQKDKIYFPNEVGKLKLESIISKIKRDNKDKEFDCLMGLSGGLDSSYLAYLGFKWGLRIYAVHIDDSFDTEISKENLKKLSDKCKFELHYIKPDLNQFVSLTKAYMKAGVPNIATPQDNILFAEIYKIMKEKKIKYFLSGGNYALECILQEGNSYTANDITNIKNINYLFGDNKIDKLNFISQLKMDIDRFIFGIKSLRPLDLIEYNKVNAFEELKKFCGFEYYGSKHLENYLTAFVQTYWLYNKFGVDKRTSHISSMIISGQMSREEGLLELQKNIYDEKKMNNIISMIKTKLSISDKEFDVIMSSLPHQHNEYKTSLYINYVRPIFYKIKEYIW